MDRSGAGTYDIGDATCCSGARLVDHAPRHGCGRLEFGVLRGPDALALDASAIDAASDTDAVAPDASLDTDGDGLADAIDPLPRDPWPTFFAHPSASDIVVTTVGQSPATTTSAVESWSALVAGDFDGDGRIELVGMGVLGGTRSLFSFERDAAGAFVPSQLGPAPADLDGAIGDVNRDGLDDVVTPVVERDVSGRILRAGLLVHESRLSSASTCAIGPTCAFVVRGRTSLDSLALGLSQLTLARPVRDLDGDGLSDVVLGLHGGGGAAESDIYLLRGLGDGTFAAPAMLLRHAPGSPANAMVVADLTRDGEIDLLAGFDDDGDPGQSWIYEGRGAAAFDTTPREAIDLEPSIETGFDQPGTTGAIFAVDLDSDGALDLVSGRALVERPAASATEQFRGTALGRFEDVRIARVVAHDATRLAAPPPR